MLESLIVQSPLSGTGLETEFRHENSLDCGSKECSYWLVTRKADGVRMWLKSSMESGNRRKLADELRLLERTSCPGVSEVAVDGTKEELPYLGFRYQGETVYDEDAEAGLSATQRLSFCLGLLTTVHHLETARPPVALRSFSQIPLLMSPALKRPYLLGLGDAEQTASAEAHNQARMDVWKLASSVLPEDLGAATSEGIIQTCEKWAERGQDEFEKLHQTFNAAAFKYAARDL